MEFRLINPEKHLHENVPTLFKQVDELSSHRFSLHSSMSVKFTMSQ